MARTSRAEAKANTRDALLRAAGDAFAERGFNGTSVEDIAERAGFTRGAFYANFADKADALLTVFADRRAADMADIAELMDETPDDRKLEVMQAWFQKGGTRELERALRELSAQPAHEDAVRERLARLQADTREVIAATLRGYREAHGLALPEDDGVVASFIVALGEGIAIQEHVDPRALPENAFTLAIAYLWDGLTRAAPT